MQVWQVMRKRLAVVAAFCLMAACLVTSVFAILFALTANRRIAALETKLAAAKAKPASTSITRVEGDFDVINVHNVNVLDEDNKRIVARLSANGSNGELRLGWENYSRGDDGGKPYLFMSSSGPYMDLTDAEGYQTRVGIADLTAPLTGVRTRTTAASLVMFNKDGRVSWQARPRPLAPMPAPAK